MVLACFALISQIGAMVLLISPEYIKLQSCACAQIEALEEENRWLCPDDARDSSQGGKNAAILISDGSGHFCPFISNWYHGSSNISSINRVRKLHLRSN